MDDLVPPSYEESTLEEVPAYISNSEISARWHIIEIPAKGLLGSPTIRLVSDVSAITNPEKSASQSFVPQNYNLILKDDLHFEAYEVPPFNTKQKTPLLAHMYFAIGNPTKANLSLSDKDKAVLTLDGQDLLPEAIDSSELRLVTIYETMSIEGAMPICCSIELNRELVRPSTDIPVSGANTNEGLSTNTVSDDTSNSGNVVTKRSKRSWRDQFKDNLRSKDKRKSQNSGSSSSNNNRATTHIDAGKRKQTLGSCFKLRDAAGNVYAEFANKIFAEKRTSSTLPEVEAQLKRYHAWGYLDIYDPDFACLRSSFEVFNGWTGSEVQLLVLLTLFMTLQVNSKMNRDEKGPGLFKQRLLEMLQ